VILQRPRIRPTTFRLLKPRLVLTEPLHNPTSVTTLSSFHPPSVINHLHEHAIHRIQYICVFLCTPHRLIDRFESYQRTFTSELHTNLSPEGGEFSFDGGNVGGRHVPCEIGPFPRIVVGIYYYRKVAGVNW
jgi:hypothetical protein